MTASAEEFIREWQKTGDISVTAETLGITRAAVSTRLATYRNKGIKVRTTVKKSMMMGNKHDVEALNAFIDSLNGDQESA